MPLYEYRCLTSGDRFERFLRLEDYQVPQFCNCNSPGIRLISRPMISIESVEYDCPITGKMITSKLAHEENLKLHGCRVQETGEKEAAERFRADQDKALDASIEETVERKWEGYSSAEKETLANDLTRFGLEVERA